MSHYICDDIVVKILRLLPVKYLLRMRCVSRRIKEIIESHSFVVDHLFLSKHQIIDQSGLSYLKSEFFVTNLYNRPLIEESMKDPIGTVPISLLGTHHGVVCLYDYESGLTLWNPSTRQLSSRHVFSYKNYIRYSGFLIDLVTKDFKVILFGFFPRGFSEAILYKSAGKSEVIIPLGEHWRNLREFEGSQCPALMIGGMAYWTCYKEVTQQRNLVILSFDFGRETFDQIETPMLEPETLNLVLCKWHGNLSLMYWAKEETENLEYKCKIYSRQDGSWVNMFSFNVKLAIPIDRVFWVLGIGEMGRVVLCFWGADYTDMFLYDTGHGLLSSRAVFYYFVAHDFVESLLFP